MSISLATPFEVRSQLVKALELDLVGPGLGDPLEDELLRQAPSRWYLTGFLVPFGASDGQRIDETVTEEVDAAGETGGIDDGIATGDPGGEESGPSVFDRTERDVPSGCRSH